MGRIVRNEIDYSGSPLVTDSIPNASSVNPITSAGVHNVLVGQEELLKDTVGFTSKNLFTYPYGNSTGSNNGITYTDNGDGTWTLNGTATATSNRLLLGRDNLSEFARKITSFANKDVIISDGLNRNDVWIQFWHNNGGIIGSSKESDAKSQFTIPVIDIANSENWNVSIMVANGTVLNNVTIYPMLRKADIMDDTYEPHYIPVGELFGTNILTNSNVSAYTANNLLILRRDITNAYYNGSLKSEIAAANFKNVRPGDYIIGQTTGTTYYVVDLDYWWHRGDKANTTENPGGYTHHLCIMPYKLLTTGTMTPLWQGWGSTTKDWHVSTDDKGRCPWAADTNVDPQEYESVGKNDTTGGYLNSYIKTYALDRIYNEWLIADFGVDNVLKFRNIIGNATNTDKTSSGQPNLNGYTSDWMWVDSYCDLPSEPNLFGNMIFSSSAMDVGCQYDQLALFKQASLFTFYNRIDVWTKAVSSSPNVTRLHADGYVIGGIASNANWVCPLALIK